MGWQPRFLLRVVNALSLVSRLAAPFLMENNAVHCLGVCEGSFHNHFFNSLLSATYMGG